MYPCSNKRVPYLMNTNPNAIRVLCYGDSNTWGYIPSTAQRYSANTRWPGVLQNLLGNDFEIVEEGLNGRTTNVADPIWAGRSGKPFLEPCLETHTPFSILILFLGTNDLKQRIDRTAQQIADGIQELITIIQKYDPAIKIVLVCPASVDESVAGTQKSYRGAQAKSLQLPGCYKATAQKYDIPLVNLQELVTSSKTDGFHFEPEAHVAIARALEKVIRNLCKRCV